MESTLKQKSGKRYSLFHPPFFAVCYPVPGAALATWNLGPASTALPGRSRSMRPAWDFGARVVAPHRGTATERQTRHLIPLASPKCAGAVDFGFRGLHQFALVQRRVHRVGTLACHRPVYGTDPLAWRLVTDPAGPLALGADCPCPGDVYTQRYRLETRPALLANDWSRPCLVSLAFHQNPMNVLNEHPRLS